AARHCIADVGNLAAVRSDNRLDALRPPPSWLEIQSPHRVSWKPDDLDTRLAWSAHLVWSVMRLGLEFRDREWGIGHRRSPWLGASIAPCRWNSTSRVTLGDRLQITSLMEAF